MSLLALAHPALAGADLQCVLGGMSADERDNIGEFTAADREPEGPGFDALQASVLSCGETLGWDLASSENYAALAVAFVVGDYAGTRLRSAGVDTALIGDWLDLAVIPGDEFSADDLERLLGYMIERGSAPATLEQHAFLIGNYLGALVAIERSRRVLSD
ncbi:MAG: hypothetical protein ACT4OE_05295 [Sphingosinicella sp.]